MSDWENDYFYQSVIDTDLSSFNVPRNLAGIAGIAAFSRQCDQFLFTRREDFHNLHDLKDVSIAD